MIQIIGLTELAVYYTAYFLKAFGQRKRGIKTNQLGKGSKSRRTAAVETMLNFVSIAAVIAIGVSAILDFNLITNVTLRVIGLLLLGLGTVIFIIAMINMKDSWRAGIPDKDKTEIVTGGIYKISRNPAFLGFDITYIGASLAFGNPAIWIMAAWGIIMMHLQILEEEKYMAKTFGMQYLKYKSRVGRYFLFL